MEIPALHQPTRTTQPTKATTKPTKITVFETFGQPIRLTAIRERSEQEIRNKKRQRKLQFLQSIKKGVNYETTIIRFIMIWGRMSRRGGL